MLPDELVDIYIGHPVIRIIAVVSVSAHYSSYMRDASYVDILDRLVLATDLEEMDI